MDFELAIIYSVKLWENRSAVSFKMCVILKKEDSCREENIATLKTYWCPIRPHKLFCIVWPKPVDKTQFT